MIIFTIGHSRHAADHFVALLREHSIGQVVDVRSQPRSRWAPHFDEVALTELLAARGLGYVSLGRQLGGRPEDPACYRFDGSVDYARRAVAPDFEAGIRRLVTYARGRSTAVMCAEEDPSRCHRRLLLAPAIARSGAAVVHIRGNGRLEPERDLASTSAQLDLFGGGR